MTGAGIPVADLLTRSIPPQSIETERAILGCCLSDPDALPVARARLRPSDFFLDKHGRIFAAMVALAESGRGVDVITISDALKSADTLAEVGGPALFTELCFEAGAFAMLGSYIDLVLDKAAKREAIRVGAAMVAAGYNGQPAAEALADTTREIEAIAARVAPVAVAGFPAMLGADLLRLPIDAPAFHVSGWIPRRSITLVFGDSEAYKSWYTLLVTLCVAAGKALFGRFPVVQAPTLVISEENGLDEDKRRLGALARGIGLGDLDGIPIHVASETGFSFDDPLRCAALRAYVVKHGIQLVVLDSFIRMHRRKENDAGEMAALYADKLRPLIEDGVSLVLIHHRRKAQPGPVQPGSDADDIRGSGDIRAAAHSAIALRTVSESQVLVRQNKSRGFKRQEPFVFAVQDTDDGATVLTWEGKPEQALDKSAGCREAILEYASTRGAFARKDLEAKLKGSFSRRVFDPILKALAEKGTPLRHELRNKASWYTYVRQSDTTDLADDPEQDLPF